MAVPLEDVSVEIHKGDDIMTITSILENTTKRADMQAEHGLGLYIESNGQRILFDMGQTDLFSENARALGIDLSCVDIAVLSHGHYDHGGGLRKFLEINDHAPVYVHKDAFLPHYNGVQKYIGLDTDLINNPRIIFTDGEKRIGDGLCLYTFNEKERLYDVPASGLNEKSGEEFIADDFRHEQYLLLEENGKRVLISGCSHKGILNIAGWIRADVIVGGFHFSKLPLDDYLIMAAKELGKYPAQFYTCHCTGMEQYEFMSQYMDNLHYLPCGEKIEV